MPYLTLHIFDAAGAYCIYCGKPRSEVGDRKTEGCRGSVELRRAAIAALDALRFCGGPSPRTAGEAIGQLEEALSPGGFAD